MSEWFESWFDSPYYHILYNNRDYSEAQHFIDNLMREGNYPLSHHLLDLACGKGRHSIYLNSLGYRVTGLDLSQESINNALGHANETLQFRVHDMRNPLPEHELDLVLNLFTSFGYFENRSENEVVLKNVYHALRANGRLIIDFLNSEKVKNTMVKEEVVERGAIKFQIHRELVTDFICKYISFQDKGQIYTFQERVQLFSQAEFKEMLDSAGFVVKAVHGDYNLGKFDPVNSDRLILIADKK